MRIVRIALEKYFFDGIPVEDTITQHKNIYDFCLRLRTNRDSIGQYQYLSENGIKTDDLSRTTRYYISNQGGALQKKFIKDGKVVGVNIGFVSTIFNQFIEKEDYNINYRFYILEAKKIINQIEDRQLYLF